MQLEDQAIILDQQRFQESKYILSLLTKEHGLMKGLFASTKKNKADMLSGNISNMFWNARLSDHLGIIRLETITNVFTIVSNDQSKMIILNSALAMCKSFLHEKEPQTEIYNKLAELMIAIRDDIEPYKQYVLFELLLLSKSGYGLDLSKCIATGETEKLNYISPKSGAAVSKIAGEPYKDKMFKLPLFFLDNSSKPVVSEIQEAIKILSHFMEKFYFFPYGKKIPSARNLLIESILINE